MTELFFLGLQYIAYGLMSVAALAIVAGFYYLVKGMMRDASDYDDTTGMDSPYGDYPHLDQVRHGDEFRG